MSIRALMRARRTFRTSQSEPKSNIGSTGGSSFWERMKVKLKLAAPQTSQNAQRAHGSSFSPRISQSQLNNRTVKLADNSYLRQTEARHKAEINSSDMKSSDGAPEHSGSRPLTHPLQLSTQDFATKKLKITEATLSQSGLAADEPVVGDARRGDSKLSAHETSASFLTEAAGDSAASQSADGVESIGAKLTDSGTGGATTVHSATNQMEARTELSRRVRKDIPSEWILPDLHEPVGQPYKKLNEAKSKSSWPDFNGPIPGESGSQQAIAESYGLPLRFQPERTASPGRDASASQVSGFSLTEESLKKVSLEAFLSSGTPDQLNKFVDYSVKSNHGENIYFLLACNTLLDESASRDDRLQLAKTVQEAFLGEGAKLEINLNSNNAKLIKKGISEAIRTQDPENLRAGTIAARKEIIGLMRHDAYDRFIKSLS